MSSARLLLLEALALGACSGSHEAKPAPDPVALAPVADAGVDARPHVTNFDPTTGHLDDDPTTGAPVRSPPRKAARAVEVMLRSAPTGARVSVDGDDNGVTPVLWQGETGDHEFTFTLKDHALARYRFWVVSSGVVHARLEPVTDEADAGVVPPPEVVPVIGVPPPPMLVPDGPAHVMAPLDAGAPMVIDAPPRSLGPQP